MRRISPLIQVLAAGLLLILFSPNVRADLILPGGTEVEVAFDQDVSSKYVEPGELVPIHLIDQIEMGGIVLVKAGCKGTARIKSVKSAGKPGKPGRVEVELVELVPDGSFKPVEEGQTIKLAAVDGTLVAEGKGRKTLSWLFIFGLFIKGTEGFIPADQAVKATVTEDIFIVVE